MYKNQTFSNRGMNVNIDKKTVFDVLKSVMTTSKSDSNHQMISVKKSTIICDEKFHSKTGKRVVT